MESMKPIEHEHLISIFQEVFALGALQSTCAGHTFRVDGRGEVHHHRTARIIVALVVERLDQSVAVSFIDIMEKAVGV